MGREASGDGRNMGPNNVPEFRNMANAMSERENGLYKWVSTDTVLGNKIYFWQNRSTGKIESTSNGYPPRD